MLAPKYAQTRTTFIRARMGGSVGRVLRIIEAGLG